MNKLKKERQQRIQQIKSFFVDEFLMQGYTMPKLLEYIEEALAPWNVKLKQEKK